MGYFKLLDLKSVPCPLNVVKIKLALEKLSPHEELIIELDKGEPEEMVNITFRDMGYFLKKIEETQSSIKIKISNED